MRTLGCVFLGLISLLVLQHTFFFWSWVAFGVVGDLIAWTKPVRE